MDQGHKKHIGEIGEAIASKYLKQKNYKILDKNFFQRYADGPQIGEVDLIVQAQGGFLENLGVAKTPISFVEVKTVYGNKGFAPELKVNELKKRKIEKMAEIWMEKHKKQDFPWQIDVVAIVVNPKENKAKINHFRNV